MTGLHFDVVGIPVPQGSKSVGRGGHMYEANKALPAWREAVIVAARQANTGTPILEPVAAYISFRFNRPKRHWRTGKRAAELRDDAPFWHATKPDADKLARAVLDALTQSGVLRDDSQVAVLDVVKCYIDDGRPGACITVRPCHSSIRYEPWVWSEVNT